LIMGGGSATAHDTDDGRGAEMPSLKRMGARAWATLGEEHRRRSNRSSRSDMQKWLRGYDVVLD